MEWNMEENFSMEWKIVSMEWKIASMKYGKIVFHSIPCPADSQCSVGIQNDQKLYFFALIVSFISLQVFLSKEMRKQKVYFLCTAQALIISFKLEIALVDLDFTVILK